MFTKFWIKLICETKIALLLCMWLRCSSFIICLFTWCFEFGSIRLSRCVFLDAISKTDTGGREIESSIFLRVLEILWLQMQVGHHCGHFCFIGLFWFNFFDIYFLTSFEFLLNIFILWFNSEPLVACMKAEESLQMFLVAM